MQLLGIKVVFPSVAKGTQVNLMKVRHIDRDLLRWTERFLSDRTVEMIIGANAMEGHLVEARVLQASPVSPILFVIYTSGQIKWVEQNVSEAKGLSIVDDLSWVATGSNDNHVVPILERCATNCIDWAGRRGLQLDPTKMEAALSTRRWGHRKHLRPNQTAKIKVRNGSI